MSTKCPRCKTGLLMDATVRYAAPAVKCQNCGCHHEIGGSRESIDRQMTGHDPAAVKRRAANGKV